MKWDPNCLITSNSRSMSGFPERLEWLDVFQLNNQPLPVYPTFFADDLINIPLKVKHIVTYATDFL